jgi:hypothetical protein
MRSSSPSDETPDSATAHWQRVKALWHAVHDQPDDVQAAHFSDERWDDDVRDEVRRLLRHSATMGDRFETPALIAFGQDALVASTLADMRAGVAGAARTARCCCSASWPNGRSSQGCSTPTSRSCLTAAAPTTARHGSPSST